MDTKHQKISKIRVILRTKYSARMEQNSTRDKIKKKYNIGLFHILYVALSV